ncbi:MAG: DegT/DnrJ/EryC1/StrS family aminotransferase [Elusimicrobiota bacterium]
MPVPFNDLKRHNDACGPQLREAAERVVRSGWYTLGEEVAAFEREFAAFLDIRHCVGAASGSDALELALRALGVKPGDEVITAANASMYSACAALAMGAVPVFADVDPETMTLAPECLAAAATAKTRAVIATHLYGRMADMDEIVNEAARLGLALIEDCAQAHGARRGGRKAGTFGAIGCFSFYPTKNLGALGDGGALVTADDALAAKLRALGQYGWGEKYHCETGGGRNSRLDELQAAFLRVKLPRLTDANNRRREIARRYSAAFRELDLKLPAADGEDYVAHLYVIRSRERDALRRRLADQGVAAAVHYPVPDHRQPIIAAACALPVTDKCCAEVLSLPCFPEMTDAEVEHVIQAVKEVCHGKK